MAIALSTILVLGFTTLAASGLMGYALRSDPSRFAAHFELALAATLLGVFGHAMTMFYFIGTGKAIKDVVRERNLDADILHLSRRQNMRASSWATLAITCLMFQFVMGGGTHTRAIPALVHEASFYITLLASGAASYFEIRLLSEQNALADRVNGLVS